MRQMVKRWQDDQRVWVVVTDHDARMAKVILESRENVMHEYNANHTKRGSIAIVQNLRKRTDSCCPVSDGALETGAITSGISQSPVTRRLKCERIPLIAIVAITPCATIQHIRVTSGRTGTCLKPRRRYLAEGS
jgi:hypothetical protein